MHKCTALSLCMPQASQQRCTPALSLSPNALTPLRAALPSYKTDPIRDSIGAVNGNGTLPSGVWAPFPDTPNLPYAYGNAKYVYVTLFNQSDTSATYGAVEGEGW